MSKLLEIEKPSNIVRFPLRPKLEASYMAISEAVSKKFAGDPERRYLRLEGVERLVIDLYATSNPNKYPFFDQAQDELAELGIPNGEIPECLGIILQCCALGIGISNDTRISINPRTVDDLETPGSPKPVDNLDSLNLHPKIRETLEILNLDDEQEILKSPIARAVKVADLLYLSNIIPWRYEGITSDKIQEHKAILDKLEYFLVS